MQSSFLRYFRVLSVDAPAFVGDVVQSPTLLRWLAYLPHRRTR